MNTISNSTVQRELLVQKKRERRRTILRRRRIAFAIFVFAVFVVFIYLFNLLFEDNSKSYALEVNNSLPKKEISFQEKKIPEQKVVSKPRKGDKVIVSQYKPIETIYNEKIPMPKEHQEWLYELCEQHGLDYKKTLAVIKHESVFDANVVNQTNDYGYFQINLMNHEYLSQKLGTPNTPLDPYINMQWGTYMLADLYSYYKEKGYAGEKLDKAVWSSYNRGINGFKENGYAIKYIEKMKEAIQYINHVM